MLKKNLDATYRAEIYCIIEIYIKRPQKEKIMQSRVSECRNMLNSNPQILSYYNYIYEKKIAIKIGTIKPCKNPQ